MTQPPDPAEVWQSAGRPADAAPDATISVVIPARNAAATLAATLEALAAQAAEGFEVIVVDNGSSDETAAVAAEASVNARVIRRPPGEGPGAARNEGAAAATGRWLAFTDADCVPTREWLREGLAELDRGAELVQGPVRPDPTATLMPFDHTVWIEAETRLHETANLFVSRDWFERVGGFEDLTPATSARPFGEDAWLGWRLRRAGARFAFAERALVHHAVFRRGPRAYVAERWRRSLFPLLARRMPELRDAFFLRWFLSPRTAAVDAAAAAAGTAVVLVEPMALLAAVPYLVMLIRGAIGWRRLAPGVVVTEVVADLVGFAALVVGSVRHRALVL
jgi:glycosyltransferase involved in cell wall biosynthesis